LTCRPYRHNVYAKVTPFKCHIASACIGHKYPTARIDFTISISFIYGMLTSRIFRIFSISTNVNRMKILLVDDHTILLDGVRSLLHQEEDLEVVGQAGSAEAALEFLKKNTVDLIITDYNMPGMDGLALLHTVKRLFPETKLILLSMHDEVHLVK